MRQVAWLIAVVAVVVGVAFLPLGTLAAGLPLADALIFAIGLLVANVPEGLLPTITLALAVGVRRLARRGALVKRLSAVETLGSTDRDLHRQDRHAHREPHAGDVRLDRRGERRPRARGDAARRRRRRRGALLARRSPRATTPAGRRRRRRRGDPTELALLDAGRRLGADPDAATRGARRRAMFHFDPGAEADVDRRRPGRQPGGHTPRARPTCCSTAATASRRRRRAAPLDRRERASCSRGRAVRRARACASSASPAAPLPGRPACPSAREDAERELCFLGLVALLDPPRPEVADAVARCHAAGIRIIVVTGDHGLTAAEIARRVGIVARRRADRHRRRARPPCASAELDELLATDGELIFARTSPEAKLRIADALRARGHVVAMTGDGVNDAPALRPRRHRRRDGPLRHRRRARGGDDGAHRRQLRHDRGRRRGGAPGLRQHPQVHPLHLRPRAARGRAVPRLRALGRRGAAAPDRAADPRHRPRHGDPPRARARPRSRRAGHHGAAATTARRRRDRPARCSSVPGSSSG